MDIEIKLGDKKVSLPQEFCHWQWIGLKQMGDDLSPINLISVCSGLDKSEIKKADMEQIEIVSKFLSQIYFSGQAKSDIILTFFHNGIEYGLQKDFSKLKYGAWVDLEVYSAQDVDKNIPKILSLLYYPIKRWDGKKYILEDYSDELVEKTAMEFQDIPMRIWWGASSFFLLFVGKYIGNIQSSLNTRMKLQKMYQKGTSVLPKFLRKKLSVDFISTDSKS